MNDFHQLLVNRRSIRRYTPEPVSADDVKLILEAALMAPTSKSSRAWQFVAVENPEILKALSECKEMGATPIANAPLAIVVTCDPEKSEAWLEDAAIAASYIQLQAADLGLGTCWIQVLNRYRADDTSAEEYVQRLLMIPPTLKVVCIITIGHPDETRKPQDVDKLRWEQVHIGQWQDNSVE